jgi:radical SAM protein with 4Fe4S-binding SPASM domain
VRVRVRRISEPAVLPSRSVPIGSNHLRPLTLQWHVTERCNLRCAHCYQESYVRPELPTDSLRQVLGEFKDLLSLWKKRHSLQSSRGRVTVTGGEPLVRDDLFDLLEALAAERVDLDFAILTNGSLIDDDTTRRLADLGPSFVQVSLEGGRTTNDRIRGPGTFDRVVAAMERLVRQGVRTHVSFTAQRSNYREFGEVARLGVRLGVDRVWADRMVPHGSGSVNEEPLLSPEETRELFEIMRRARAEASSRFCRTEISLGRALQFLVGGGTPYRCAAGDTLITLMPDGDVYPCRRMPIRVGNVTETPLAEIYERSGLMRALRDRTRVADGCRGCRHIDLCGGGLRCLAHAVTGDPFTADPGCWHARNGSSGS